MRRIDSAKVADITEAAKLMVDGCFGSLAILKDIIEKKPLQTAWNVVYMLDEQGVYGEEIFLLYEKCNKDYKQFTAYLKQRRRSTKNNVEGGK